ncbi:MAG: ThiF family adenylyltransferase [Microthrixaceae bacterium]
MKVRDTEEFTIQITEGFPWSPPTVTVPHYRWLGEPHVLEGNRLCLFLDPQREWAPAAGSHGVLERLWGWLDDAVAGRHATQTALHHGFGGTRARTEAGAPMLVVRRTLDGLNAGISRIDVKECSTHRYELVSMDDPHVDGLLPGLLLASAGQLPMGVGRTLEEVVRNLEAPWRMAPDLRQRSCGFPTSDMVITQLSSLVQGSEEADRLVIVVAAPNGAVDGPGSYDLMAAHLTVGEARAALANMATGKPGGTKLEFFTVDDVRPEILVRRDTGRPTGWYRGRSVELWGCGALGSWIGELLIRAGVSRLVVHDPASVSTGLLVRQNYAEADVGTSKATALTERLRAVDPAADITSGGSVLASDLEASGRECDLIIDATASAQVACRLDALARTSPPGLRFAQVATDSSSATLGLVAVATADCPPSEVDRRIHERVTADAALEGYQILWDPADDFVTPARGCSTPTFRGSASDVMGVAASAVSLLGGLLRSGRPGGQLFALPHSPVATKALTYIEVQPDAVLTPSRR